MEGSGIREVIDLKVAFFFCWRHSDMLEVA
jgi:hypothetical protein